VLVNLATGLEDPERVTVAFLVGGAALAQGKTVAMFLTKEAVRLALPGHAHGVAERPGRKRDAGRCYPDDRMDRRRPRRDLQLLRGAIEAERDALAERATRALTDAEHRALVRALTKIVQEFAPAREQ
jgi:hypothetical protein